MKTAVKIISVINILAGLFCVLVFVAPEIVGLTIHFGFLTA